MFVSPPVPPGSEVEWEDFELFFRRTFVEASGDMAEGVATQDMLRVALSTLSRRQREVVVLRHLVGLSELEVVTALAIGHGTVKTHLRRGLTVLRDRLDGEWREAGVAPLG
jgi:DNA-directed RNA polymerase specialized sigma24 family protein